MADNKVLIELQLVQKGQDIALVQKNTENLARSTDRATGASKKFNKQQDTQYNRQKQGVIATANSTKNFSKMQQSIDGGGGAGGLVRAYALLAANVFALTAAFGILSRSAEIDTLTKSIVQLEIVSGKSIRGVARDLQEASGFGMSFAESMRSVSLATSAGFGGDKIVELGKVAKNAAVSLGRNVPDALDRIFRGVIKVEPELLDEIGLFVRVNEASAKYASELGKAAGDLTEFEKRQAFMNEALEQGTAKFAAFEDIQIDPFAELSTVFADMSQSILEFLLPALEGVVGFLTQNKAVFAAVFAAVAFTLLKMAIPAMGLFTRSLAENAAMAAADADAQRKRGNFIANQARQNHIQQLQFTKAEIEAKAKLAMAESQAAGPAKLSVRGKQASRRLELALQKEGVSLAGRRQIIEQRIADITSTRGLKQRMSKQEVKEELALLTAELKIHQQITAEETKIAGLRNQTGAGGFAQLAARQAKIAAIKAEGLATVVATAETEGFRRAMATASFQAKVMQQQITALGGTFGFFSKSLFMARSAVTALGVAFQGLMAKIMGPLSIIFLLLPAVTALGRVLGIGSEAAENLTKANKGAAEALDLLGPRLEHYSSIMNDSDASTKETNLAAEAFANTIGTTARALLDQSEAFDRYQREAEDFAFFFGETLPALFGGGTANAIKELGDTFVKDLLKRPNEELSEEMRKLLTELEKNQTKIKKRGQASRNDPIIVFQEEDVENVVKRADEEAKALTIVRSAIDGAKDAARAFSDSLIVKTDVDKPLATFRQIESALSDSALSEQQRGQYINEISEDAAVLRLLTQEQRNTLQDVNASEKDRRAIIQEAKKEYFEQQELLIKIKQELKAISTFQKIVGKSAKDSADAAEMQIVAERRVRKLKEDEAANNLKNKITATGLTEAKLKELSAAESLQPFLDDETIKKENIAQVQAAIVAFRDRELRQLQNAIDLATEEARITMAKEKAVLSQLKRQEKLNQLVREEAKLTAKIGMFGLSGRTSQSQLDKVNQLIKDEESARETRQAVIDSEMAIVKAQFEVQAVTMETLAKQEGVTDSQKEMYNQAAIDLRAAGDTAAQAIQKSGDIAGDKFVDKLLKLTSPGSGFAEQTFAALEQRQADRAAAGAKDKDGNPVLDEAAQINLAINSIESTLLSFAESVSSAFGEDGVLVSTLATVSANLLDLGQNFGITFANAEGGMAKAAVVAGAASAVIGQVSQLTRAQAEQDIRAIDSLIEAEKKRDGKSQESLAKIAGMEKKKEAMKRKAFEDNKKMMLAQAVMSTAQGIATALAGPPGLPFSAIFAAMMAAMGAKQISIIKGMTYQGGGGGAPSTPQALTVGKRDNSVDVAKGATAGELAYLRGERGIGSNANNFTPAGATGMKGYTTGGAVLVGEQGPEIVQPTTSVDIVPNERINGGTSNVNFTINAVDAAGVQEVLEAQRGNIIGMIREAAHDHGEEFLEPVDTSAYGGTDTNAGAGGYG